MRVALAAFRSKPFRLLFAGELVSLLGTAVAPVALAFAVLDLTGSATDLGYVLAAGWLPQIVFILIGGVLGDRLPRNLVMVGANLLSAAAQGATAALLLAGVAAPWHLAALAAVRGTATALFFPAAQAVVPEIVEAELLQPANALLRLATSFSTVIGAGLGGIAVAAAGPGWAIAFDAATYLASALILVQIRIPRVVVERGETIIRELVEGWNEFRSREWLWVIVVSASVGNPARPLLVSMFALLPTAGEIACYAGVRVTGVIATVAFFAGIGLEIFGVNWITALQQHIPRRVLSRVNSYDALGSFVFIPLGLVIAGPLADRFGVTNTLWGFLAIGLVSIGGALLSRDVRTLRRVDGAGYTEAEARATAAS
ncbi:MAG: hypothetical protein AUG88_06400 [Actinobacteria bacterium 13_1_20CM_4_68_12]|nr:MAG: hypothetical protein AUG88_06400 [Actinobacteria bacterium 13_1_20CM_4_68_12]